MNSRDYLTNRNFCPIPWTGLMYNFDGNIKNCIRSSAPIGNIQEKPIDQIVNGVQNVNTRFDMISDKPGPRCSPCYELEKEKTSFNIISDRVFYLKELKTIPIDTYQHPNTFNLHTVDVRWTNLCNFSCVYCGPEFSSKWENELGMSIKRPSDIKQQEFKQYVFERSAQLKHVYLAGGEPLLMKENLEFLQLLLKVNPGVNLRVNTNLSKVDTGIFNLICNFKNVHWIVSVEAMEDEYEYIRYGGSWENFINNLTTIRKLEHNISFNMLHFLLNYKSVFACIDYFKKTGFHNNSFILGALLTPEYLNIRHLPDSVLNLIKKELECRINEHPGYLLENGYRNVLEYIQKPFEKDINNSFVKLKELDKNRHLDSTKIFKELYNYGNQTF